MKQTTAKRPYTKRQVVNNPHQLDLLKQESNDIDQIIKELEERQSLIANCIGISKEIVNLLDTDADRMLKAAKEKADATAVLTAVKKTPNHWGVETHAKLNSILARLLRNADYPALVDMRDMLVAGEEVKAN